MSTFTLVLDCARTRNEPLPPPLCAGICFGYEIGVIDAILVMPSFAAFAGYDPLDHGSPQTTAITGWIVSSFLIGF